MLKYRVVTDVAEEPVSLAMAKKHLRVTVDDDDEYISSLVSSAREYAEGYHGVSYRTKEVVAVADFPAPVFKLPVRPATGVSLVTLKDSGGEVHDITDKYMFDEYSSSLLLKSGASFGDIAHAPLNPVEISFTAGRPPRKRTVQAMLIMIGEWYENREASVIGVGVYQLPLSAKQLLEMDRHSEL